ncbi:MAG: hypothetical protein V2L15_02340, partial [Desulfobacteraceae bacterium]|nr:hypothetical protein [Desulfobacteraceae bacterium]
CSAAVSTRSRHAGCDPGTGRVAPEHGLRPLREQLSHITGEKRLQSGLTPQFETALSHKTEVAVFAKISIVLK